jgi:hypothetical protein
MAFPFLDDDPGEARPGRSLRTITAELNAEDVPTAKVGQWHLTSVKRLVDRLAAQGSGLIDWKAQQGQHRAQSGRMTRPVKRVHFSKGGHFVSASPFNLRQSLDGSNSPEAETILTVALLLIYFGKRIRSAQKCAP